jgi:hypothetical protein
MLNFSPGVVRNKHFLIDKPIVDGKVGNTGLSATATHLSCNCKESREEPLKWDR